MSTLTIVFAHTAMRFLGKGMRACFPEIAEGPTPSVLFGNLVPQASARLLGAVTDHKGHNLARSATESCLQPSFVSF